MYALTAKQYKITQKPQYLSFFFETTMTDSKFPFPPNESYITKSKNRLMFGAFLGYKLPLGFIAGLRIEEFTPDECSVSLPYRWRTQNPFRSIYFAAQSMAAEMSTAALAMLAIESSQENIAMLVTDLQASFSQKANDRTTFTCNQGKEVFETIQKAIETGEGTKLTMNTIGRLPNGTEVSRFSVTWSFKKRKSK